MASILSVFIATVYTYKGISGITGLECLVFSQQNTRKNSSFYISRLCQSPAIPVSHSDLKQVIPTQVLPNSGCEYLLSVKGGDALKLGR